MLISGSMRSRCYQGKERHGLTDGRRRTRRKTGPYSENNISARGIPFSVETERFPYDPFNTVPLHSTFDFSIDAYSQPVPTEIVTVINEGKPIPMHTLSLSINLFIFPSLAHKTNFGKRKSLQQDQADKRFRPFARRELKMARPALVSMRVRKPCFRLRFRLLG